MTTTRHSDPTQQPLTWTTAQGMAHHTVNVAQTVRALRIWSQYTRNPFRKDLSCAIEVATVPSPKPEFDNNGTFLAVEDREPYASSNYGESAKPSHTPDKWRSMRPPLQPTSHPRSAPSFESSNPSGSRAVPCPRFSSCYSGSPEHPKVTIKPEPEPLF